MINIMRLTLPIFAIVLLFFVVNSCDTSAQVKPVTDTIATDLDDSLAAEIVAIEQNLQTEIRIAGEDLETYSLRERMLYYGVPGLSMAVVKNGKIHWAKAYGVANVETNRPLDEKTLFQAASISKPVSALAVLHLAEAQAIHLDTAINVYLKDWQLAENEFTAQNKVTVRHVLTHAAGLNVAGFAGYAYNEPLPTTTEILQGKGKSDPLAVTGPVGEQWRYSGGGYVLLQKLVEDASGISFEQYMDERILAPMGMLGSTYQQPIDTQTFTNISTAHDHRSEIWPGKWHHYPERGAGGLWTNPTDLAKYCLAIKRANNGDRNQVLQPQTVQQMLTKHPYARNWGLGPALQGEGEQLVFTHDGSNAGFRADFFAFANQGNAAVVMTNSDNGGELVEEVMRAIASYYGWETRQQTIIHPVALTASELMRLAGSYSWIERPAYRVEFTVKGDQLWMLVPEDGEVVEIPLIAEGPLRFIDVATGMTVSFEESANEPLEMLWRGRFRFRKQ